MSSRDSLRMMMYFAGCLLTGTAIANGITAVPCLSSTEPPLLDRRVEMGGTPQIVSLPAWKNADLLVQAVEDGIDVEMSLVSARGEASADSPVSRRGVQRLVLTRELAAASITLRSVDVANHRGAVRVLVTTLPGVPTGCMEFARDFARADALFAAVQQAARGEARSAQPDPKAKAVEAGEAYLLIAGSDRAEKLDAVRGEAELSLAAIKYYNLSLWKESASWAHAAAKSFENAQLSYLRARARSLQAAAWLEKPDTKDAFERARGVFGELAAFHRSRRETYEEALQINYIGVAYFNEAQFDLAIPKYLEAEALFTGLGEKQRSALALQNLALCEWGLGRMRPALRLFDQALAVMDPKQRPTLYMLTLNNAALANQVAGDFDKSLQLLEQALNRATQLGDGYYRARSLFGIGVTYYGIGDRTLARQFLMDALSVWTPELDERGRVSALRALAVIESEAGNLALADRYNSEALQLARSPTARDRIALKMAETALARGDLAAAEKIIEPLAAARPHAERLTQAEAWVARARLRVRNQSLKGAESDLRRALVVFRELESLSEEFEARVELAGVLQASGDIDSARKEIETALQDAEELRVQTANPEYRASVAGSIRPALDLRLDLLHASHQRFMQVGDLRAARAEALQALSISDATRARAFELYRRQNVDSGDAALAGHLKERAELLRELGERRFYLATREDREGPDDVRAQALRKDIRELRVSLGVVDSKIAGRTGGVNPAAPRSIEAALRRFARDDGTAAIEYWIGTKASYAWVVHKTEVSWIRLADGPTVAAAARRFHASLASFASVPRRERLAASSELNRLIIAPLQKSLEGTRQWVIAPDGPLHFIPFAALRDSAEQRYLIQRVSIAMTPALRHAPDAGEVARRPDAGRMLLVSDPIYEATDARLSSTPTLVSLTRRELPVLPKFRSGTKTGTWVRLPETAREASGIRLLFPASSIDELQGADANRGTFLHRDLGQYRYLHIAAHGVMDTEIPAMSALILGAYDRNGLVADQQIRAGDLLTTRLDADLVVLSACDTSLGPSFLDEGPMGLRYAVLSRGARAVVSSLWATADEINADLMTEMYGRMIGRGERVELALANAMRTMLGRTPTLDPALWAPYSVYLVAN